jgi:hypothetical protein
VKAPGIEMLRRDTYFIVLLIGHADDLLPNSGYVQSPGLFVGFQSTPQKHHNCEASIAKMALCKCVVLRSILQNRVRFTVIQGQKNRL